MVLAEITERIIRSVFGGKAKNETQVDYAYIESKVPKWRQQAISVVFNGSREQAANEFIPPQWLQSFTIAVPASENGAGNLNAYITIDCPAPIRLNIKGDGFNFVGDATASIGFIHVQSPSYASDLTKRGDLNKDTIGYVVVGDKMRLYGNKQLESVDFDAVLSEPLDDPDFNIDTDDYPVSEDVISVMERIAAAELAVEMGQPEDLVKDGVDTKDRRANKLSIQ